MEPDGAGSGFRAGGGEPLPDCKKIVLQVALQDIGQLTDFEGTSPDRLIR
jgi:hypothetical protein